VHNAFAFFKGVLSIYIFTSDFEGGDLAKQTMCTVNMNIYTAGRGMLSIVQRHKIYLDLKIRTKWHGEFFHIKHVSRSSVLKVLIILH